jgi:hypothetical protein
MASERDGYVRIPATIYPGVFPREYQVSITFAKRELHLNVSEDFVTADGEVTEAGAPGTLAVEIVDTVGEELMIRLPGEVLGAPSRVRLSPQELQIA